MEALASRMRLFMASLVLSFALFGCGDDTEVVDSGTMTEDTGVMEEDAGIEMDAGDEMDAGGMIGAPYVVQTNPEDSTEGVDPATSILILFSESMSQQGTVSVEPGDITLNAATGTWASDTDLGIDNDPPRENIAVILDTPAALGSGFEYTVTVNRDFADASGVALDEDFTFTFRTSDSEAPVVTASTPAEGATGVSATLEAITMTFSEEMNTAIGSARLAGGPGRLGDPTWEMNTISWPVIDLDYGNTYTVTLEDFVDRNGNLLDGSAYLGDGVLNFETGADVDAPVISSSVPTEGQRGVNPAATEIRVVFSEPMNTMATDAAFSDGTTTETLSGVWSSDGTVLTYDITGRLTFMSAYTLDFSASGLEDLNGNAFDGVTYLGDSILDFTVETDTFGPRVVESTPAEGATEVEFSLSTISFRFDEPMDDTRTAALLDSSSASQMISGVWSAGGTLLDFDVRDLLRAGENYSIDMTGFADANGNALDATDAYLVDGILNFQSEDPSGDSCAEALTVAEGTAITDGHEWIIPSQSLTDNGSTDSCDSDSSGGAGDLVIRFDKASGDLASGGRLLRVTVESGSTSDLNFEVRSGTCDPSEADDNILACQESIETGGTTLDVGAGTYYIWIAKESSGTFPGATVRIEEVGAWPEGESCNAPFTTTSSVYLAPTAPDRPHVFQIPSTAITTFDRDRVSNGPGEISCSSVHGSDAVVRFDKMAGSVLDIRIVPADIRSGAADLNFEISQGCDPAGSSYVSLACESNFDRLRTAQVSGPAGPIYIWLSSDDRDNVFPGATVEIREVLVGDGESCGTARPLTAATSSITLDSARSLGGGSCLPAASNITWFSYTATEDIVLVSGDAAGEDFLLMDQETNLPLACADDATQPTPALIRAGRTVCIGVSEGSTLTELTVSELAYSGVRGEVTDLGIGRALNGSGVEEAWTTDAWMASTANTLYMAENSWSGYSVYFMPKTGSSRAVLVPQTSATIGDVGLGVGSDLFSLDDSTASTTRLYRLTDGVTYPWSPEAWDTGFTWPTSSWSLREDVVAMGYDGTTILIANHETTSSYATIFYSADPTTPGSFMEIGQNENIENVTGLAADATFLYLLGERRDGTSRIQGVHRLARAVLSDSTAPVETIAAFTMGTTYTGRALYVDNTTAATVLYTRNVGFSVGNQVLAVVNPGGAEPFFLGPILRLGTTGDYAMTYDATDNAIYLFETETDTSGRIVRVN